MAAAVADFRPATYAAGKIKKKDGQEPDADRRSSATPTSSPRSPPTAPAPGQVVVGFAAETDDVLANGRAKLRRKGCDLLVVNEVGERKAFGSEENEAVVLGADGSETPVPYGPKEALADTVWDLVVAPSGLTARPPPDGPPAARHRRVARPWRSRSAMAQNARAAGHSTLREARQRCPLASATDKLFADDAGRSPRPVHQ